MSAKELDEKQDLAQGSDMVGNSRFDNTAFFRCQNVNFLIFNRIFQPAFFDLNQSPHAFLGGVIIQQARWHTLLCKLFGALIGDDPVRNFFHLCDLSLGASAYCATKIA